MYFRLIKKKKKRLVKNWPLQLDKLRFYFECQVSIWEQSAHCKGSEQKYNCLNLSI